MSTRYLVDGDFLKLKNVALSYTFPKHVLTPINLSYAKLFVTADNLYVWSKFKSGDPEQRLSGRSHGYLVPTTRNVRFGLEVKF